MSANNPELSDIKNIDNDIRIIVGGNFTPDSLSPDTYNEILSRVRTFAKDYLERFELVYLGSNFDAISQSRLHLPTFLKLLVDVEPDLVRKTAAQLLKQLNAVMVIHDEVGNKQVLFNLLSEETVNLSRRLEQRRIQLQELIK